MPSAFALPVSHLQSWTFSVESSRTAGDAQLTWTTFMPGAHASQLLLLDVAAARIINTFALDSYTFSLPGKKEFRVYYRDDDQPVVPDIMIFGEPYPNPSVSSVHTTLILPESAETMAVEMVAYNIMGQPVKSIVSASFHGGIHEVTWDGNDFSGSRVPAGMYIILPKVNGQSVNQLHKVILK